MSTVNILLFDVDGVLVEPRAYRIAIRRTLEHLLGADAMLPTESEIAFFESRGVHDVWDIANIVYAQLLTAKDGARPDYKPFADKLGARISEELADPLGARASRGLLAHPPLAALDLLSGDADLQFLSGTRSVHKSRVTRLFQNILLGNEIFQKTYELPGQFDGPSLLSTEDRALLSSESVERLKALRSDSAWKIAVYTARPSYPPPCSMGSKVGYSPEAEVALGLVGMNDFPLVGMGTMEWVAGWYDQNSEELVKPNTTQAYTALLCALSGALDNDLLSQAYLLGNGRAQPDDTIFADFCSGALHAPAALNITVFEDTVSGIRPMQAVAARLRDAGYSVTLNCLGIAKDSSKREALSAVCQSVYDDTNDALNATLALRRVHS